MPIPAHSPEFARLATRWLDGSATPVEAAQLWECIGTDPACAREFAEQSRFELLLQDTLREQRREQGITAGARQKTRQYHRRTAGRQVLAVAAVVIATGFLVWLAWPAHTTTSTDVAHSPTPPVVRPLQTAPRRTTVLVTRQEGSGPAGAVKVPLRSQLDVFFLTGVNVDKMPLKQALKLLEEQLRELNFASNADLAALRIRLPAGAGNEPVTFHSGSISFLKAARALAGLAGYDVDADETGMTLVARTEGNPNRSQSRSVAELLARLGNPADASRSRLAEMLDDARALGLRFNLNADGTVTGLNATAGDFDALAILAQSRDQVRAMPPLRFYVKTSRSGPGAQDRIISGDEAAQLQADFIAAAGPNLPPAVTVPIQETSGTDQAPPGKLLVMATPVGTDRIALNVIPPEGGPVSLSSSNPAEPGASDPLRAIVSRHPPDVLQFQTSLPEILNLTPAAAPQSKSLASLPSGTSPPQTFGAPAADPSQFIATNVGSTALAIPGTTLTALAPTYSHGNAVSGTGALGVIPPLAISNNSSTPAGAVSNNTATLNLIIVPTTSNP